MKNFYWVIIWILAILFGVSFIIQSWTLGISIDLVSQIIRNSDSSFINDPLYNQFLAYFIPTMLLTLIYPTVGLFKKLVWNKYLPLKIANLRKIVNRKIASENPRYIVSPENTDKLRNQYLAQVNLLIGRRYNLLNQITIPIVLTISSFVFMMVINWAIGLIALGLAALPFLLPIITKKVFVKAQRISNANEKLFNAQNKNYLQGIDTVIHYKKTNYILGLLIIASRAYQSKKIRIYKKIIPINAFATFLAQMTKIAMYLILGAFFFNADKFNAPQVTIAIYIAYGLNASVFFGWATNLLAAIGVLLGSKVLLESYDERKIKAANKQSQLFALKDKMQNLSLKNITFKENEKIILSDFSYDFEPGKKYLIKGPSGIGKSVLMKILLGILKPQSGEVLLNGKNLEKVQIKSWLEQVHYIAHDSFVINDAISQNIFTLQSASIIRTIKNALQKATLENRFEDEKTVIKENELSSGEKQKINFLRFFIENKQHILFLDEAMSNIDKLSRQKIWDYFKKQKDLMIIYISHDENAENGDYFDKIINLS